jgi:hypothetical protein
MDVLRMLIGSTVSTLALIAFQADENVLWLVVGAAAFAIAAKAIKVRQ